MHRSLVSLSFAALALLAALPSMPVRGGADT